MEFEVGLASSNKSATFRLDNFDTQRSDLLCVDGREMGETQDMNCHHMEFDHTVSRVEDLGEACAKLTAGYRASLDICEIIPTEHDTHRAVGRSGVCLENRPEL